VLISQDENAFLTIHSGTLTNKRLKKLAFAIDFVDGDPPFYGQVSRDNARLAPRLVEEPVFPGDIRGKEDLFSASITLGNADEINSFSSPAKS
jgi:hypothetical protein